jgi:hypothetical protein
MRTRTAERPTVAAQRASRTAPDLPARRSVHVLPPAAPGAGRRRWRAVGAVALAAGALVTGMLVTRPPEAPAGARALAVPVATLPAMPASMGLWDLVLPTATPLPAMPNDLGFWDRLR